MFTIEFHRRSPWQGSQWSASLSELTVAADTDPFPHTLRQCAVSWGDGATVLEAIRGVFAHPRTEDVLEGVLADDVFLIAATGGGILRLGQTWLRVGDLTEERT